MLDAFEPLGDLHQRAHPAKEGQQRHETDARCARSLIARAGEVDLEWE